MECWGGPKPKGENWCIRHLNDIKSDNRIQNLRWGLTNMKDKKDNQIEKEEAIVKASEFLDTDTIAILTSLPSSVVKDIVSMHFPPQ